MNSIHTSLIMCYVPRDINGCFVPYAEKNRPVNNGISSAQSPPTVTSLAHLHDSLAPNGLTRVTGLLLVYALHCMFEG
jgi:hypothetical protein